MLFYNSCLVTIKFTVQGGEPYVTHGTSWPGSTGECSGRPKTLVSIALQKEANATLVGTKQNSMLLSDALVKGAYRIPDKCVQVKQKAAQPQRATNAVYLNFTVHLWLVKFEVFLCTGFHRSEELIDVLTSHS